MSSGRSGGEVAVASELADLAKELGLVTAIAETSGIKTRNGAKGQEAQPGAQEAGLLLRSQDGALELCDLTGQLGPLKVDFLSGISRTRQKTSLKQNPLIKALGGGSPKRSRVLDATAGLGRDMMDLLTVGFEVVACESHPVMYALLRDGIARAGLDEGIVSKISRLMLVRENALEVMKRERFDLVYLDPMYPVRETSASPKKDLQYLRRLVSPTPNLSELLGAALACARDRVVVKRPPDVSSVEGFKPNHCIETKMVRFDVYLVRPRKQGSQG